MSKKETMEKDSVYRCVRKLLMKGKGQQKETWEKASDSRKGCHEKGELRGGGRDTIPSVSREESGKMPVQGAKSATKEGGAETTSATKPRGGQQELREPYRLAQTFLTY